MKKLYLLPILVLPMLFLSSCTEKEQPKENEKSNYISSNSDTVLNFSPFTIIGETSVSNPFNVTDTSLIFPNWEDNNKISILNEYSKSNFITTSSVDDFFEYPTNSLTVVNNVIYFANGSSNNNLSFIDLTSKEYTKINNHNVHNLLSSESSLYYINKDDKNKVYIYDTLRNTSKTVFSDSVGKFILNGDFILYQNLDDNSKLYKIHIDGSQKEKLTDFSVDSFAPYQGELLIINSSDNNNLYSLNPISLSTKRLYIMNGENLKSNEDKLYYINLDDSNYLYSLDINLETGEVSSLPVISDGINDYFPTPKAIFFQKRINVNNVFIKSLE